MDFGHVSVGAINGINSLILHKLPICSRHMRPGILMHQEESWTQCTNVGSDSESKEFILIPIGCQGTAAKPTEVCTSLCGYASPGSVMV